MKKIIALAIVLLGAFTYVAVNSFSLYVQMPQNGYVIEQANVLETLKTENNVISVETVTQDDEIYKRNDNLYLNRTSFEFTESLPLVLSNTEVTYFFDESSALLANDFYQTTSFKGMYLSCGISFNPDFTQADEEEWILARMYDLSYMNAQLIKVVTNSRTVYIENSSFIDFKENSITYNTILEDGSVYSETISALTEATISLGQNRYNYSNFYEYLKMSEEDSSFTIDSDKIDKDTNMPSTNPILEGGAQLTVSGDGKYVEIDKTTVAQQSLITEDSADDKSGDIGGQRGEAREEGNDKDLDDDEDSTDFEDDKKITEEEEEEKEEKETKIEINIPKGKVDKEVDPAVKEDDEEGELPTANNIIIVEVQPFTPWVYTAGTTAVIYDGGNRMVGNVKFVVTNEAGDTVSRKIASSSGEVVLNNLPPDTTLTVTANYRYKNEEGIKIETGKNGLPVAYKQTFHTRPLSEVQPVKVNFKQSETAYSKSTQLLGFSIANTSDTSDPMMTTFEKSKLNSINYIFSIKIEFTRVTDQKVFTATVPNSILSRLKLSEVIDYVTDSVLDSRSEYTYEIKLLDRFGNQMKTTPTNLTGKCYTKKEAPSASFRVENNEAGSVTIRHTITDVDGAMMQDAETNTKYRYRIKNEEGLYTTMRAVYKNSDGEDTVQTGESLKFDDTEMSLTFTNLPYSNYLTVEIYADIDMSDGQGLLEEQLVASYSFYSAGIISGSLTYTSVYSDIGGTSAKATFRMSQGSNSRLASLMTDLVITFTSLDKTEIRKYTLKAEDMSAILVDENFQLEDGGYVIKEANEKLKEPQIRFVGTKASFQENLWQSFLNGGKQASDIAQIEISFPAQSLSPSTTYLVSVESLIDQGLSYYHIETIHRNTQFTTLKREPVVHNAVDIEIINNTATLRDIYITDQDTTIVTGPVSVELVRNGITYDSFTMNTGVENKTTHTFSNLMTGQKYQINFKAKGYNNGTSDITLELNKTFYSINFTSNSNINGTLEVGELNKSPIQTYTGENTKYAGKNMLDPSMNIMQREDVQAEITRGHSNNYNGNLVENANYFASGYIPVNKDLPLTWLFRRFSITTYYGDYITTGSLYGNMTFYFSFFEYNEAKGTYTYLGYTTVKGRGDYYDATGLSYATRITHIKVTGFTGYEDLCELYQGIEVLEVLDNTEYQNREIETLLNGYGEYGINTGYTTIPYYGYTVHPGDIWYSYNFGGGIYNLAFYDEDGNIVQTMNYYYAGGYRDGKPVQGNLFVVPNNAVTMTVSWANAQVDNPTYFLKRLSTSEEKYVTEMDITIEDLKNVFTEPTSLKLVSWVGTDRYDPSNHDALVQFQKDKVINFFEKDTGINKWTFGSDITLDMNTYYYFELYLTTGGRTVLLDTAEIYTESDWDFIYTWDDFSKIMHNPLGQYKVMADIVMPTYTQEGNNNNYNHMSVEGILDFNGHVFTPASSYWGFDVGLSGTVKNMVINYEYPGMDDKINCGYIFRYNYGTIENVIIEFNAPITISCNSDAYAGLCYSNGTSGVIKNCAIIVNSDLTFQRTSSSYHYGSLCCTYNNGKMYNVYAISANGSAVYLMRDATDNPARGIYYGTLCFQNQDNGVMENCYTAVEVWQREGAEMSNWSSNFVNYNVNGAIIKNCFAVGNRNQFVVQNGLLIPTTVKVTDQVPCLSRQSGSVVQNSYYFSGDAYTYAGNQMGFIKGDSQNIKNPDWYTGTLGFVEGEYQVRDPLSLDYYPRLNFPASMAVHQPYVSIGNKYTTNSTMRVTDIQVYEQDSTTAKACIYIYNPNKYNVTEIKVEGLSCYVDNAYYDDVTKTTELYVALASPQKYLSAYKIVSINYAIGKMIASFTTDITIPAEFFRTISNAQEWQTSIRNDPSQNYRLVNDIDFSKATEGNIYISKNFSGKLDGTVYDLSTGLPTEERYALKNINIGTNYTSVINNLTGGSITNIIVENMHITPTMKCTDNIGFIRNCTYSKSVLDNITIIDSSIDCAQNAGMLLAYGQYLTIRNCSSVNCTMYDYLPTGTYNGSVCFGGLVGRFNWAEMTNCFVYNLHADVSSVKTVQGVGGLVGYAERARIQNVYTHGFIYNYSAASGGIVGCIYTSRIMNGYSYVTIEGSDIIGGLVGRDNNNNATNKSSSSVYRNLMALGDIYIKSEAYTDVHRLFGTAMNYGENVYAYGEQKVSPALDSNPSNKDDAKRLIASDELVDPSLYEYEVDMGDQFDYSSASSAIIPKLYKSGTTTLLQNQEDIYLTLEGVTVWVNSANIISDEDGEYFYTEIGISHPEGYTVKSTSVSISNMELLDMKDPVTCKTNAAKTQTIVTVKSTKTAALDQYTMNFQLSSTTPGSNYVQNMTYPVSYSVNGGAIYWEINNYTQWKETMKLHGYTNENFKITGKIDFSQEKGTPSKNLMINRLVGTNGASIENVNLTGNSTTGYFTLFQNITSELTNIEFKNCEVNMSQATGHISNFGLICQAATVTNCSVDGFKLTYSNRSQVQFVGFIGRLFGNAINFDAKNVNISQVQAGTYTCNYIGTIGYASGGFLNCDFEDITITCPMNGYSQYVGGAIGYSNANYLEFAGIYKNDVDEETKYSIKITRPTIQGYAYVGGAIGGGVSRTLENLFCTQNGVYVYNAKVRANCYAGGAIGYDYPCQYYVKVKDSNVYADHSAGGINGYITTQSCYYYEVENTDVDAIFRSGGLAGYGYGYIFGLTMRDMNITGGKAVAGIVGYAYHYGQIRDLVAENINVEGRVVDTQRLETYQIKQLNSEGYEPDGSCVGFANGLNKTLYWGSEIGCGNIQNCTVKGTYNVGGLFGEVKVGYAYYVASDIDVSGNYNVGGVYGKLDQGYSYYRNQIRQNYFTGTVTGDDYVGGWCGLTEHYEYDTEEIKDPQYYGFIGMYINTNGSVSYYSYSNILNFSLKCTSNNCDYYTIGYDKDHGQDSNRYRYCGAIDTLRYMDTTEMSKGGGAYTKIKESDLPKMYWWMEPEKAYSRNPEIFTADDLLDVSEIYHNRTYNGLNLDYRYFTYLVDYATRDYPYLVTKTADNTIEISGLGASQTYDVTIEQCDNQVGTEGLLLYYDCLNNTGEGTVDKNTKVWKNLGSLGSDYDMTIYTNSTTLNASQLYEWTDDGLFIKPNTIDKNGNTTGIRYNTMLTTDPEKGRLEETQTSEYTISVTLQNDYYYGVWQHLFGTYIDYAGFSPTNRVGPMLYGYHEGTTNRYYMHSGRWDNNWLGLNAYPADLTGQNKYRFTTITCVYELEDGVTNEAYIYHKVHYYVNGIYVGSNRTSDYYTSMNYKDITDGWVHMLCCPKKSVDTNGQATYTYSYSGFAGYLYSAKFYDYAMNDLQVKGMYEDDYLRYKGSGTKTRSITDTYTSNAKGVIQIKSLDKLGLKAGDSNITVYINNNESKLNNVNLSEKLIGLTVRDAENGDSRLTGYSFKNKKLLLDSGVVIAEGAGNTVQWYRSYNNSYRGELIAEDEAKLYVNMRGYYYAIVNGQYTPIIYVDNDLSWPIQKSYWGTYQAEYSEGRDAYGNYNSTEDYLINGGTSVSDFAHNIMKSARMMMARNSIADELPMLYAYTSDVDAVTLELESDPKNIRVTVTTDDGLKVIDQKLSSRTLAFKYDFVTPFTVEWTDGTYTSTVRYKPEEIRNTVSTYNGHYYYLTNMTVESDERSYDYTAANIYKDQALLSDRTILNLVNEKITSANTLWSITTAKPLFTFDYGSGNKIDVYYSYSLINGARKVEGQVIIDGSDNYTLTPDVSDRAKGIIVDSYSGEKYLTVINDEMIVDLYDNIKYPEEFDNSNIREISCSADSDDHIVLVRYGNGKLVGFNYLTGKQLDLFSTLDENFLSFLSGQLKSMFTSNKTNTLQNSYRFAANQMTLLSGSSDESVLTLFAGKGNPDGMSDADGSGDGNNPDETVMSQSEKNDAIANEILTSGRIHGKDVAISYNKEEGRFVIKETSDVTDELIEKIESGNKKAEEKKLQDQIDEIAESGAVPGLSKGIIRKSNTISTGDNTMVTVAFGIVIATVMGILVTFLIKRYRTKTI